MQLGMIGLGRMGNGMTKRLEEKGHEVKTYDPKVPSTAKTLGALKRQLDAPRHVWMMIPAGEITEKTFQQLVKILEPGDTIIDGGNSNFRDSQRRYKEARKAKISFVDVGVSGGIWGLEVGFCLMAGGDKATAKRLHDDIVSVGKSTHEPAVALGRDELDGDRRILKFAVLSLRTRLAIHVGAAIRVQKRRRRDQ